MSVGALDYNDDNSFTVLQFPDPSSVVTLERAMPLQLGCISNTNAEDKTSSGIRIMGYQFLSRQLKTIPKPTAIRKWLLCRQPEN